MAAKKELFWLGLGVKTIDGVDYGAEMPLPVEKIDQKDLKKMKADGRIGALIAPVVADGRDNKIAELESELAEVTLGAKKTIAALTKDLKEAGSGDCEDCKEKDLHIAENDGEVKRLTSELEEATKPVEEAK